MLSLLALHRDFNSCAGRLFLLFLVLLSLLCAPASFAAEREASAVRDGSLPPSSNATQDAALSMMCTVNTAEGAACPSHLPQCCQPTAFIHCCPANVSCEACMEPAKGFLMSRGSFIVSALSLLLFVLLGSVTCAGVGRFLAWKVERRRIVATYREHAALQRKEMRAFQEELASVPARQSVPEREACVVCCARPMDCAFAPCGHVCCCHACAKRMERCAVCRGAVERYYTLPPYLIRRMAGMSDAEAGHHNDGEEMGEVPTYTPEKTEEERDGTASSSVASRVKRSKVEKGESEESRKWQGKNAYQRVESEPE